MWQKRGRTRGMLRIPMAEGLTPWGLTVGRYRLELKTDYVVVGVVGKWL